MVSLSEDRQAQGALSTRAGGRPKAWHRALALAIRIAWAGLFLSLPVTSFPYLPPAMGGGALVRPLAIYPLLALILLVTLPRLFKSSLPRTLLALLPFAIVTVASGLLALLRGIDPALGIGAGERVLRALLTLGVGGAIYVTVALLPRSPEDLRFSLRWLYAGFSAALLWGSLQAVYVIHDIPGWYNLINRLQHYVSIRKLIRNRVSGLTYEPNWFAEQLTFLLMPWLLAAVLTGTTVFKWRRGWLTVELVLLGWSIALLPFTASRAGVINLVGLVALSLLFFLPKRKKAGPAARSPLAAWLARGVQLGAVVVVLAGLFYFVGTKNEFFARIWDYWQKKETSLTDYFEYLGFGARFTYSETAMRTFEAFPVLGVGPGNYAFYFDEMLPERPLAKTPEVLRLVTPEAERDRLITPKNFYLRLLAETGLLGMAAFAAFLVAILGSAIFLWFAQEPEARFWGIGGLLGLGAFLLSAFSFDSFAIPNVWVVFGLITAATWVFRRRSET